VDGVMSKINQSYESIVPSELKYEDEDARQLNVYSNVEGSVSCKASWSYRSLYVSIGEIGDPADALEHSVRISFEDVLRLREQIDVFIRNITD
jgi:hypothetical protein